MSMTGIDQNELYTSDDLLGVSVDVVMAASVTLGVGYVWQICLLYNTCKIKIKKLSQVRH